jgi:nitric oxide reductase subunit B
MNARRTFHSGLSAWWRVGVIFTVMAGFAVLIFISVWAYKYSPPIPKKVVNAAGDTVFTGEDILAGQQVFLKYGLMENGTIWGHGAYLGPDFSAAYLHTLAEDVGEALAGDATNTPSTHSSPRSEKQ